MIYAMKKVFGILFLLFFINAFSVCAAEKSIQLKDNLNLKINNEKLKQQNLQNTNNVKYEVENKKDINAKLNKNEAAKLIEVSQKVDNKKSFSVNETQNNTKNIDVLSNSLNVVLVPQVQIRPEGIIYQETQRNIDVMDPQKEGNVNSNYPGLRGPNQLVVYTPSFGLRTGTNEFGTEAIVEKNMVVRLNGADSIIPKNGFVISGHGSAKKWIIQNIQVGSKVYIDYSNNTLRVFLTPDSLLYAAKEKIKEVNNLIEYYRQLDILYNDKKANEYLNMSKEYLRKAELKPEKTQTYINDAMNVLDLAIKNAIPYIDKELKGVWIRPVEKNSSEISKTIDRLANAGITDIFLETYFHGKTIYPSDYLKECGVINQREEFIGFDPLEIWIKEAHKQNIKVHIWFETFYVGNEKPEMNPNHVLSVYPNWANKRLYNYNSEKPVPSLSEHNGYFLDPSNMQVQTYLLGILNEIITKYNPDGINLDYIRYPQTVEPTYSNYASMNWGYTQNARDEFKALYGIDPIDIKYGTYYWNKWALYRQNQITEFLKEAKKMTKAHNIVLTAVVFPDLRKCIDTKMQNWRNWSLNNYVDGLTPLILTGDKNTADLLINDVVRNTSPHTDIYPGIFVTFMGGSMDDLLLQIHKTREYNTKGAILFDYAHLNDDYVDALTTRVFNKSYEPRDVKINIPQETKQVETKQKKKRFWRRNNDKN